MDSAFDFPYLIVRDNYVSKELSDALKAADVPFRILPELSRYETSEIKTLLAYVRLGLNSAYTPLLVRVLEGPHKLESKVIYLLKFTGYAAHILILEYGKTC